MRAWLGFAVCTLLLAGWADAHAQFRVPVWPAPKDPLTPVRTTETCMSPTTTWRHFRILRRTIARDDKLVFSIYSYNAVKGDNFEIKRFTVMRKTRDGWKRVDAAFGNKQPAT